jgi:phage pi2 protein 07
VCNAAEFILPSELASASQAKLVIKDGEVEREIILKANSKWVMDEEKLSQFSDKTLWLVFSWDKKRHAQILQVENGDILIFAEKVGLTYKFKIRIDKFLSGLWGK